MMQKNVLWLEITMYDALGKQCLHSASQLAQKKPNRVLIDCAFGVQIVG